MSTALANPAEMMRKGAPRVIHSDRQLALYTDQLLALTDLKRPSAAERDAIELLSLLIEQYESQRFPMPEADGVTVLRFLMEQNGLTQRELAPDFGGSESMVSMVLSGQRKLTIEHIHNLCRRFHVPADVFLG